MTPQNLNCYYLIGFIQLRLKVYFRKIITYMYISSWYGTNASDGKSKIRKLHAMFSWSTLRERE